MRRFFVVAAIAATIVTAGIVLAVTSIGGAATKAQAGYPIGKLDADKIAALKSSLNSRVLGATAVAIVFPGVGLIDAVGIRHYAHPATGIYCLQPKGAFRPPLLTPIGPASGPAIIAWDLTFSDCPVGWYQIRVYYDETGDPTDDAGFLLYVP